jgi:hypothetical protein
MCWNFSQIHEKYLLCCMFHLNMCLQFNTNISQIILYFLGPDGVSAALPQGGQMSDEYPANEKYYMEGLIKQRWVLEKVKASDLKEFSAVSAFVCGFIFNSCLHLSNLYRYLKKSSSNVIS